MVCDGHTIPLTAKSAELLAILLAEPNAIVATDLIRERLWPSGFVEPGNLPQQIYVLRRALAVDPSVAIETHARRGYRLRAQVAPPPLVGQPWWRHHVRSLVASAVAAAALVVLPGGAAPVHGGTANVDAPGLRTYALGRYFWMRRGDDNFARAASYFERTVALAPNSALGYAGLAEVYGLRADAMKPGYLALAQRALHNGQLAVAKDNDSGVAHASLGLALLETGSEAKGVAELRRAIDLDTGNAEAHEWYAIQLLKGGDVRGAARHFEAAAQVEPENVAVTAWRAWMRYYLHDFDAAAADFRTALQLNPAFSYAQVGLAEALMGRGRYVDAKSTLKGIRSHDWMLSRAVAALGAIVDIRLGLRQAAHDETRRLQDQALARSSDSSDEFVVAAVALDGRRSDALRLRARMHLKPYEKRMIDLDPLVGPVFRDLNV